LVVFISLLFLANIYLFYLFFVVRNNAVQYCSNVKWCHLIWAATSRFAPTLILCVFLFVWSNWTEKNDELKNNKLDVDVLETDGCRRDLPSVLRAVLWKSSWWPIK